MAMADRPLFTPGVDRLLRVLTLGLTLVLCCAVGLYTPYIAGLIAIAAGVMVLFRARLVEACRELPAQLFLFCFLALGVVFAASGDYTSVFNFAMLALFGPLALLLVPGRAASNGVRFAQLATAGAAVALAVALLARYTYNIPRAQFDNFGSILLGNTAVLLGFLGLTGVVAPRARLRWLYLAAPLLGVATAVLTGSRGPLLAVLPLALLSIFALAATARRAPLLVLLGGFAVLGLGGAVALTLLEGRVAGFAGVLVGFMRGEAGLDNDALIRLNFYLASIEAFAARPLLGYGWDNMMTAIIPYLTDEFRPAAERLPQLHNDLADFAVAGGLGGLAIYVLLLATPILAALRSPRDSLRPQRLLAVAILVVAYVFDGFTDLMFGFEFHTWLYVALTAIILSWCRDPEPAPPPTP